MSTHAPPTPDYRARWTAPATAIAVGLAAASGLCRIIAQLQKSPSLPLLAEHAAVTSVLTRSAVVGAVMLSLFILYALLALWPTADRATDSAHRRGVLLQLLSPTMAVIGFIGLWWRVQDSTTDLFERARDQQAALDKVDVVGLSSIAWMCSCVAVIALAAVAGTGAARTGAQPRSRAPGALIAALTVLAVGGVSVLVMQNPNARHLTSNAAAADPDGVDVGGTVAYEISNVSDPDMFIVAGGPGLIRSTGSTAGPEGVEALSGATGQPVWSWSYPDLWVHEVTVSAVPDSVAVLSATYRGHPVLIGLDAGTGAPLWTRPNGGRLTQEAHHDPQMSSQRFISVRPNWPTPNSAQQGWDWSVRDVRTGKTLWSMVRSSDCLRTPEMTENFVLAADCDGAARIDVFDGQTGAHRATLTDTTLGATASESHQLFSWPVPATDLAAVWLQEPEGYKTAMAGLVDVASGAVVHGVPENTSVWPAAAATVILRDREDRTTILDTATGTMIDVGPTPKNPSFVKGVGQPWVRIGDRWITALPMLDQAPTLKVFRPQEPMKAYPIPCTSGDVPKVAAVSGALIVNCGDRIAAVR